MRSTNRLNPWHHLKSDFPPSVVVFLVAMPLCLGIAMASGAPLFSGIISGVIGGIVVGALSGSPLGVSGPAAGLAVIVLHAITDLGGFEIFLVAVILAGIIQVIMGFAKAGIIAYYFPSSVIHGMLAGIGIIIFLKQIPHVFGYDKDPVGDMEFNQMDGHNTFGEFLQMLDHISPGVMIVSFLSLVLLVLWETKFIKRFSFSRLIQGPLVVVVLGILLGVWFERFDDLKISAEHLARVPIAESFDGFIANFTWPDFRALANPKVYSTALVIAVVASLETLLCVEASDKQDDLKRITPTNRELKAQGVGNIIAGFIGGLPITQVIVRSSANQQSGGKTKASTIFHGILLLVSVLSIPTLLNMIPLGVLAAILLLVGYKLAKPTLFKKMYNQGMGQFIPFVVTVFGIVITDLLIGIGLGMMTAIFVILRNNYKIPYSINKEEINGKYRVKIILSNDVTFLNKAAIQRSLAQIPDDAHVEIDASNNHFIHHDVIEIIEDFKVGAEGRNIQVEIIDLYKDKTCEPAQHYSVVNK